MSYQPHNPRGRNWFTAIGVLFCVMAGIVLARQLLLWGPEFVAEFVLSPEVTSEKVSLAMLGFGVFMVALGFTGRWRNRYYGGRRQG